MSMTTSQARGAAALAAAGVALAASLVLILKSAPETRIARHMKWVRKLGFKTLRMELLIACDLAIQCGEAMLATAGASAKLKDGQGGIDPQTKTDLTNERLVMDTLAATFPDHDLIGEETAAAAGKVPAVDPSRPTWIVDPIDGTQNFCHSLPVAAVSIGLCVDGKPAMGVIYDPYRGLLFYPRFIFLTRISLSHTSCPSVFQMSSTLVSRPRVRT